jgi:hypothetical protein
MFTPEKRLTELQLQSKRIAAVLIGGRTWPFAPDPHPVLKEDSTLVNLLKPVKDKPEYKHLKVGVVDLTDPIKPRYFLDKPHNDETVTIGSASKLAILYAAFQLREDLRNVLRDNGSISTLDELKQGLKAYWSSGDKPASLKALANSPRRWPRLERIFALESWPISDPTGLVFAGKDNCGIDKLDEDLSAPKLALMRGLEKFHNLEYEGSKLQRWQGLLQNRAPDGTAFLPGVPLGQPIPFAKRLWLTCAWSDNAAATSCWKDLGREYQKILMTESGFYSVKDGKAEGFRSGATYFGQWEIHEIDQLSISVLEKETLRAYLADGFGPPLIHSGTVGTLLAFLVALAQRNLINSDASNEMISLLRMRYYLSSSGRSVEGFGIGSYFDFDNIVPAPPFPFFPLKSGHGIDPAKAKYYDYWSKVGIAVHIYSDWAFMDFEGGPDPRHSRRRALGLVILNDNKDPLENPTGPMRQCAYEVFKALK